MYRPSIGPVSAIERAIVCMRMPGLADLRQPISRGFLHTATSGGAPGFFTRGKPKPATRSAPHSRHRETLTMLRNNGRRIIVVGLALAQQAYAAVVAERDALKRELEWTKMRSCVACA